MERDEKTTAGKLSMYIFECTMAVAYICFACALFFTSFLEENISGTTRISLACVLTAYGIFRIYRAFKKSSPSK